jgi:hypothetical protein
MLLLGFALLVTFITWAICLLDDYIEHTTAYLNDAGEVFGDGGE